MQDSQQSGLTPLGGLQSLITKVLIAAAIAEVAYLYISLRYARFADEVESGAFTKETLIQRGEQLDSSALVIGIPYIVVYLTAFILGGIWTYRAARNAALIAPDPNRITAGWAVGWHFIPLANLFKPYQAIRQIYNSSISADRPIDTPLPGMFMVWWLCFILSSSLAEISEGIFSNGSLRGLKNSSYVDLVSFPISLIALWLWHTIVLAISNAQDRHPGNLPEISSPNPGSRAVDAGSRTGDGIASRGES